jgi:hypothetical protein
MFGQQNVNYQNQAFQNEFNQTMTSFDELYNDASLACLFKWPVFVQPNEVSQKEPVEDRNAEPERSV